MPTRLAFVGQRVFFELCSLEHTAGDLEPTFLDFRHDADPRPLRAALEALDPDVIWVWRPEIVPPGLLTDLRARRVGYLTEPVARPGDAPHPDLTQRLDYLKATDPANFDRFVAFDPLIVPTAALQFPDSTNGNQPSRLESRTRSAIKPPRTNAVLISTGNRSGTRIVSVRKS